MNNYSEVSWQIRDVKHGKVKSFLTLEEMIEWVDKFSSDEHEIVGVIKTKGDSLC